MPRSAPALSSGTVAASPSLAGISVLAFALNLGCAGHAQGFLDLDDEEQVTEPEVFGCPSDCKQPPCGMFWLGNVGEVFSDPGGIEVFGQLEGWVYFSAEHGRTIARIQECVANPRLEVVARTEAQFADAVQSAGSVYLAAEGGRIFQLSPPAFERTALSTFDTSVPVRLGASSQGLLAATATADGLVLISSLGVQTSLGDLRYALSPALIDLGGIVVAQRVDLDGRTEIVSLYEDGRPDLVHVADSIESGLELLDARKRGVLFLRRDSEENALISFSPLEGGIAVPLVRGNLPDTAYWSETGLAYISRETLPRGEVRQVVREYTTELGQGELTASGGRLLLEDVASLTSLGRRLFAVKDTGDLYRRPFRPRSP